MSQWRRTALALAACLAPAELAACPEPAPAAETLALPPEAARVGHAVTILAGGPLVLDACPGTGHVPAAPQIALAGASGPIALRTESECDTVLLAATPEGWRFDDDGAGQRNARLALDARPGLILVWIGTYHRGSCRAGLVIEPAG